MTQNSSKKSMAHCCTTVPTATNDIYFHRSSCDDPYRKSDEGLIWLPVQRIIATQTVEVVLHHRLMVSPLFLFYSISKLDLPDNMYVHRPVHCWGRLAQQVSSTSAVEIYWKLFLDETSCTVERLRPRLIGGWTRPVRVILACPAMLHMLAEQAAVLPCVLYPVPELNAPGRAQLNRVGCDKTGDGRGAPSPPDTVKT